jgi:hypothetical protein
MVLAFAATAPAAVSIDYNGDDNPNTISPYKFTFVVFGGTSWNTTGGDLTMATAYARGIWFGNNGTGGVNWSIAPNSQGNYLKVVTKLSDLATEWSIYMYDGSRGAAFLLNHNGFNWYTYEGNVVQTHSRSVDLTDAFHTFEFLVKGNEVSYAVDGEVLTWEGAALPANGSTILVIGDGSGPSIGGTGSMTVASVEYVGNPQTAFIPEPASIGFLSLTGLAMFARRRR